MKNFELQKLQYELRKLKLQKTILISEIDQFDIEKVSNENLIQLAKMVLKIQQKEKIINSFNKNTLEE